MTDITRMLKMTMLYYIISSGEAKQYISYFNDMEHNRMFDGYVDPEYYTNSKMANSFECNENKMNE